MNTRHTGGQLKLPAAPVPSVTTATFPSLILCLYAYQGVKNDSSIRHHSLTSASCNLDLLTLRLTVACRCPGDEIQAWNSNSVLDTPFWRVSLSFRMTSSYLTKFSVTRSIVCGLLTVELLGGYIPCHTFFRKLFSWATSQIVCLSLCG